MATLTGKHLPSITAWFSPKNGMVANLASHLYPPPHMESSYDVESERLLGTFEGNTFVLPTDISYTFTATHLYSPFDDIYNRFYFIPRELAFGAVTGDTTETVLVWNAYIVPESVTSFTETGYVQGDNVSNNFGEETYPLVFNALEIKRFDVSVAFTGNPEFNIQYTLGTTGETVRVDVTGYRSVLFSLSPHKAFTHKYKFETRVTDSFQGEQRASLGGRLFEYFSYQARASEFLRTYYRQLLNSGTLIRFTIPVWEDYLPVEEALAGLKHIDVGVGNLEGLSYYVGQSVVLWSDAESYEQAKIVEIDYDLGRLLFENEIKSNRFGSFVMPLRSGVNDDDIKLEYRGINSHHFNCDFKLHEQVEPLDIDAGLDYLGGKPILVLPNYQDKGSESFGYERDEFRGIGGDIRSRISRGFSQEVKSYVWKCFSRDEYLKLKEFIFTTRGKWKSFWLPRFGREFLLSGEINNNDTLFTFDLTAFTYDLNEFDNVALFLQDIHGQTYYGKIITATSDNGLVSVTCDTPIQFSTNNDVLRHCCIADLVRSTTDEIEVEFEDINEITCKITVRKVKE
ncbi:hypothetical protein ACOKWN_003822 [Vibrio parahaemolyticus]